LQPGLAQMGISKAEVSVSELPTAADVTAQGTNLGTLQYLSPEQLEGQEADSRSDIFAFGTVLYEMLTGRKAFEGSSQSSLIAAITHVDPPRYFRDQTAQVNQVPVVQTCACTRSLAISR
jgi:eukaryotic-like serine/threonine-protein kinase